MLARSTSIACCVAFALALAGCNGASKSADAGSSAAPAPAVKTAAMNTTCPFSGGKVNEAITVSFGDQTVAFCCAGCKAKFEKMTDAEKTSLLAKGK